jgi:hypothetical protein
MLVHGSSSAKRPPAEAGVNDRFWCSARRRSQALFLDVMAVKADQLCSTLLLPQCGQMTLPFSYWASVSTFETFLQLWQKNS